MQEDEDKSGLIMWISFALIIGIFVFLYIFGAKYAKKEEPQNNAANVSSNQEVSLNANSVTLPQDRTDYREYIFKYDYIFEFTKEGNEITFRIPVPQNENNSQYITDYSFSVTPSKVYTDGLNKFAEFKFENIKPGTKTITAQGKILTRTYNIDRAKKYHYSFVPEKNLNRYLAPEKEIESDSAYIKGIADKIGGNTREEIVSNIYKYLNDNMTYTFVTGAPSAIAALRSKHGRCVHYAAAIVALCRAKGIPARVVTGDILRDKNTPHTWVEVYYDEYGWVNYDPTVLPSYTHHYYNGKYLKSERTVINTNLYYIRNVRNYFTPWAMRLDSIGEDANILHFSSNTKIEEIN